MSNEIVPYTEMQSMSKAITQSGLFNFKNENQALTLMLLASSEGIHPVKALQQFHIINGKPALKSSEVLARFQQSGGSVNCKRTDDEVAEGEFSHPQGGSITIKWDIQKAKTAGVYESNPVWKKYPSNMLRARVVTDAVYALYPACLGGMMTESMAQDIPAPDAISTIDVEDAEIVEPVITVNALKLMLSNRLKELDFSGADVKAFAEMFNLSEDKESLENLVNNKDALMVCVNKFENGDK